MKNLLLVGLFLIVFHPIFAFQNASDPISTLLRARMEVEDPTMKPSIAGVDLENSELIHRFYADRNFEAVWSKSGVLLELAYEMRFEIRQSKFDGLLPSDYHLTMIDAYFQTFEGNKSAKKPNDTGQLVDLELLLTDAFFLLSRDLELGKVDPTSLKGSWEIVRKSSRMSYLDLLNRAVAEQEIRRNLERLYPKFSIYKKGREVLRAMDERTKTDTLDWKPVKLDKSIKVGDSHAFIPVLRERLNYWGYAKSDSARDSKRYDSAMFLGVQAFQLRNGMEPDGIIGKNTALGLNASPLMLFEKAAVNLERLRWLPDTVQNLEMILVNIANYQLDYVDKLDTLLSARVIVGKQYHESPIFTAEMSYIVFSPYWNIPPSIARKEIIPAVRKNPNYLNQKNMDVVTFSGKQVDPASINWSARSFPYMIRQKPGGSNSLGLVKFMFPNSHNVYIHDTPTRSLFAKEDRALSHGCIRIQNPAQFAQMLLKDDPSWTPEKIDQAMHQTKEQIVSLPRKIPVVLLYLTFWADSKGQPHFRQDIYDRDAEILEALRK
ncbi:L,D-transpeptidase family protein [Algoriphagus sp. H41]|uniref:L,D-transpeptidase family protein n=1 Tax=Algoriphagus oliviformis TaxID=2811231 RepID=A0ABS3C7K0_9BACT|nr:L,D-transpeptidase family protein [Algoriphagus oliviformis]MBN7812131.1 L,D-transpeptidase family protein [Algoriphagus oliviformis]